MKGEVRKGKRGEKRQWRREGGRERQDRQDGKGWGGGSLVSEKGGHEDEERNRKTTGREGLSRVALYLHVVPIPPL